MAPFPVAPMTIKSVPNSSGNASAIRVKGLPFVTTLFALTPASLAKDTI